MLELSPEDTAANPSACSMPASSSTSRSKPTPRTVLPAKSGPEAAEGLDVEVDHRDGVPALLQAAGQGGADPAAAHDHDVHTRKSSEVGHARIRSVWLGALRFSTVVNLSDIGKRMLVGRKLRSTQLGETLLPKRIALPVFASDALSSVAYAPDEILLTLSLAGLTAYAYSWKIAILVAVVMLVVVASYRQNVHAYPSGGGDYEVATVNLGPQAGLTVASALLVDYVLTVAVSISSGVQNAKSLLPFIDGHEAWVASVAVLVLMALNLRGVRESGTLFAIPTYCFMVGILLMIGWGLFRILVLGEEVQAHSAQYGIEADPDYADLHRLRHGRPAGPDVLLRLCGADRRRGHLQRGAGLPEAQEQERGHHAAAARHHLGHHADRGRDPGQPDRAEADRRGPLALHAERRSGSTWWRRRRSGSWPGPCSRASRSGSTSWSSPPC